MEIHPLCIILAKSDSKGDRLLFRYPFQKCVNKTPANTTRKNPYTLPPTDDLLQSTTQTISNVDSQGNLTGFTDEVLSTLFAVKTDLCGKKFELKVNDVRFVSQPTLLLKTQKPVPIDSGIINIVFALSALTSHSVVNCYHQLSATMGIILRHEERRIGYVTDQTQIMTAIHDDGCSNNPEAAYQNILDKECPLAMNIKKVYDDLCSTGKVYTRINRWMPVSFCLPQKAHQWHLSGKIVEPEDINSCLEAIRPYHSLLLLYPAKMLIDSLPLDSSPTLKRMLSLYSPMKNLMTLSLDTDLELQHIFELTAHIVYWSQAIVIFPVCATNKYVVSPKARIHVNSPLIEKFRRNFPGCCLIRLLSEFSLPTSLSQKCTPLCPATQQSQLVQHVIWLLQHHLLLQLHTYILYMPTENGVVNTKIHDKKNTKTPSPRNSVALSSSYQRTERSRTESESGTSTFSEAMEFTYRSFNIESASFTSADDEKQDYQEELLLDFPDEERASIFKIPATNNPEDLKLFAKLCRKQYFQGNHHLEEIMYLENLRRSQILQLLDKFSDVLITYETEDPALKIFY